ncbi:MAG: glycosyltransferase family 39 protein, partial [Anaerolineae bacterium]
MKLMSTQVRLDDRSPTPAWVRAILFSLILVSFAVRLWDLEGKSLWSDEALTLRRAEQPLRLVFANVNLIPAGPDYQDGSGPERMVRSPDLHPPLYFLMMHFWVRLAGRSEFALRFPSVVAATLALPFLYVLASSFLSRETGLWAALLGAASPFYLWYAQEARMYTWLVVLSLASVYVLLALLEDEPRCGDCIAFSAITLALLYTHYAAFLLLAFETVVYVIFRLRDHRGQALIIL